MSTPIYRKLVRDYKQTIAKSYGYAFQKELDSGIPFSIETALEMGSFRAFWDF